MTKWLCAFLLSVMALAVPAEAQDRWARINGALVGPGERQAIIDASAWPRGSRGIRIAVSGGTIAVEHVTVLYVGGRTHVEKLSPAMRLAPGAHSRIIAPSERPQAMRRVTVRFTRLDRSSKPLTIEIWGLRTPPALDRAPPLAHRDLKRPPRGEQTPASRYARPPAFQPPKAARPGGESSARTRSLERPVPPAPVPSARAPEAIPVPPPAPVPTIEPSLSGKATGQPAEKPYTEVDIFFGTDRKRGADRMKFDRAVASFGSEHVNELTLGKAVVTVPKDGREKGSIPRPEWDLIVARFSFRNEDPARDFTVFGVDVLSKDEFVRAARQKLAGAQRFPGQAFVFVHGYFVPFDDALFRAAQIAHDLEFDGVPFVYSWPSAGGLLGYIVDRGRARDARDQLYEFVDLVAKQSGAREVHLIAHSMGADPLLEVLRDIQRSEPQEARSGQPRFGEIILAAPDVTRESFERIASQIVGLRRGLTLYASANDRAMTVSSWTRLGDSPAGYVPNSGPVVVPGAADTIDISSLDTSFFRVNHSTFADREALLGDIRRLIRSGARPPNVRGPQFELVEGESGSYWRYKK